MTSHFTQLHLCLQYTRSSFTRAFTARLLIHHLLLPLLQTPASLSAAEAAAQCSMGTVEIKDGVEDKWPQFLITSCVSLQNTEAPDSALYSDWMLDFSGGRAGTIATAYSFLFLPSAFKMCSFLCFPQCNCHFVGFVMQTNVFTSYNDLFAFGCVGDCKPSIFYVCAVLA